MKALSLYLSEAGSVQSYGFGPTSTDAFTPTLQFYEKGAPICESLSNVDGTMKPTNQCQSSRYSLSISAALTAIKIVLAISFL